MENYDESIKDSSMTIEDNSPTDNYSLDQLDDSQSTVDIPEESIVTQKPNLKR